MDDIQLQIGPKMSTRDSGIGIAIAIIDTQLCSGPGRAFHTMHRSKATTAESQARPWFLLLDDERPIGKMVGRFVRAITPCDVVHVDDIAGLLSCLQRCRRLPAGLLLDFDLAGGENGVQALEAIRGTGCLVPCAFMTGAPDRARRALADSPLGERPPVYSKGNETLQIAAWVERLARLDELASWGSGLRVKVDPEPRDG